MAFPSRYLNNTREFKENCHCVSHKGTWVSGGKAPLIRRREKSLNPAGNRIIFFNPPGIKPSNKSDE
jgi:hypothetical protein